jgi:osmoprotectant transport system permease protein
MKFVHDMLSYLVRNYAKLLALLGRHVEITLLTLFFSCIAAAFFTLLAVYGGKKPERFMLRVFGAVYAVPSLALFALLIPFTGLGLGTSVFALSVYNQFLLLRNILSGIHNVPPALREAAAGIGLSRLQCLYMVEIPLSAPMIMTGLRLSVISTIGIATIAAVINAGGIGSLLFDGLRTMNSVKLAWGTLLAAALAIAANILLKKLELRISGGKL